MITSKIWYKIGMQEWAPVWLKMYCLKQIFRNIQRHIESLPPDKRVLFDTPSSRHSVFKA